MSSTYVVPQLEKRAFTCPSCNAYAQMAWIRLAADNRYESDLIRCKCTHCGGGSIWFNGQMVAPAMVNAELPSPDLPAECLADFQEARNVLGVSPRAAAALMRLCIQRLMPHLGEQSANVNDAIGNLVAKGLPPLIQKSLDICRVIGNNAVHPGEIDLNDTPQIATDLFRLVNIIVDDRITRPREIEELYTGLPEGARAAIAKRDGTAADVA